MIKKLALVAALVVLTAFSANAGEKKAQGSGPNPYTECGIGAAIFSDTAWAAATSNAIWDLGTTAITSALSSPETCNAKKVKTAKLILETLESMEADVAQGGGQYTVALAETMGCGTTNQQQLVSEIRTNYAGVVAQPGYATQSREERAAGLYSSVRSAAGKVAGSCAASL